MGLWMQPRNEKFFTLSSKAGSSVVDRAAILMEFVSARALGGARQNACTTPSTLAMTPLQSASQMRAAARTRPPR